LTEEKTFPDDELIPAAEVRNQFGGICDMTLWRWVHDPDMGFPKPVKLRNRNYWPRQEIREAKARALASREAA